MESILDGDKVVDALKAQLLFRFSFADKTTLILAKGGKYMPERKIDYEKTWKKFRRQMIHENEHLASEISLFEENYDKTNDEDRIRHAFKRGEQAAYESILSYIEFLNTGRYFME